MNNKAVLTISVLFSLMALALMTVRPVIAEETTQNPTEIYLAGEKAFKDGDLETAIIKWEEVLKLKPDSEHTKKMLQKAKEQKIQQEAAKPKEPSATAFDPNAKDVKLVGIRNDGPYLVYVYEQGGIKREVKRFPGENATLTDQDRLAQVSYINDQKEEMRREAWEKCKVFVSNRLISPSTATWATYQELVNGRPGYAPGYHITGNNGTYTFHAYVDCKNRLNAEGRVDFQVSVAYDQRRKEWRLKSLSLHDR